MKMQPELCPSVVDAIGNTPLIDLARLTRDVDGRILAKLEYFNPGYSKTDEQAIQMARRLAKEEGIFAGFSSGANVAAAMQLIQTFFKGKTAVVLICDSGLKYLSTDLWE